MGNIIELKHITKSFEDGFRAVNDFNLEVGRGEFVTFLGPSGCGKTTTLRMIAGFEQPDSGQILLDGRDITQLPPNKRPINTVFQNYALFPHMNIHDNIAFGLKLKKIPRDQIDLKVAKVLKLVDLEGFEERSVSTLSGGQQQRIAIARALVNEPEILLLDEPLGALDLKMRKEMQLELKAMHEELGITFIYVTHDQEEALTMSDKIVVLNQGRTQQIGTPEQIYNEPKTAFVADFIGDSNIFDGIMTGKLRAHFAGGEFVCVDDFAEGTHITSVIRPEDVVLTEPEEGIISGNVTGVIFKGIHYEISVESGKYEMIVKSVKAPRIGETVGMRVAPENIQIIPAPENRNVFKIEVSRDYTLTYNEKEIPASLTDIIPGSKKKSDGSLVSAVGEILEPDRLRIMASIEPQNITMTDNVEEGLVSGHISNLIYEGDHYVYVIRTDQGQDFITYDEYLWNMDDEVGLIMPADKMTFSMKK